MIYAFDFDLTLTKSNSGGVPMEVDYNLFVDQTNIDRINALFFKLKTNNHKIIIVTRGLEKQVREYLNKYNIKVDAVIGSKSRDESIKPNLSEKEKTLLYLDSEYDGSPTYLWALRKVAILLKICEDELEDHNKVLFFDDNRENIKVANRYFHYCFLIKNRLDETLKTANILSKFLLVTDLAKLRYKKIKINGCYKTSLFDRLKPNDQIISSDRGLFFLRDFIHFNDIENIKRITNSKFEFNMSYKDFLPYSKVEKILMNLIKCDYRYKAMKYKFKYDKIKKIMF
ncbi:MAG: hypothetical protein CMF62_00580 [Magnetococcales bacterium]|nr:hypothetical protein [Magnetococcales bacterium]|tara:strand:+ start:9440 stop:10294 length:855 start_codon:yes stop_codon:yes gene_type:complete